MAGRRRTPTAMLEARGSFDRHPERRAARAREPKCNGPIGRAPAYFDGQHRRVWRELIAQAPAGVLWKADSAIMESTVRLIVRMRVNPAETDLVLSHAAHALMLKGATQEVAATLVGGLRRALQFTSREASLLMTCLGKLGLSPKERSHLALVPAATEEDPFEAIADAMSGRKRVL